MKKTIPLPRHLAAALFRSQHPTPSRHLGDSFHAAHDLAMRRLEAGDFPREITGTRGQRIAGTIVPANMLDNMQRDEARAWSHSDLAGLLWENGFRASRAIELADLSK